MTEFIHLEVLVSCDWVEQNRSQTDSIRIVESDEDILLYEQGHIAGAVSDDRFAGCGRPRLCEPGAI